MIRGKAIGREEEEMTRYSFASMIIVFFWRKTVGWEFVCIG
jgi:hypothetical protein